MPADSRSEFAGVLNSRRHTKCALAAAILLVATMGVAATPSAATAVGPAVNAYSESVPSAKGTGQQSEQTPTADPSQLSDAVTRQLSRSPDGKALATLATAASLGAPRPPIASAAGAGDVGSGDDPSFITATWNALGDLPVLLGLAALLALIAGFVLFFRAQRSETAQ
jgi:hypothetical protein